MSNEGTGPFSFPPDFPQAVAVCRASGLLLSDLAEVYERVDAWAAAAGAVCLGGGACCRFDRMDHRLYVTSGEFAYLLERTAAPDVGRARRGRCPWQAGAHCSARSARPLGCRLFYCRGKTAEFSGSPAERFHTLTRQIHENHCLPYRYAEMTAAACNCLFGIDLA